jgi:hypothetical protein
LPVACVCAIALVIVTYMLIEGHQRRVNKRPIFVWCTRVHKYTVNIADSTKSTNNDAMLAPPNITVW